MIARTPARRGIEERNQLVAENMGLAYAVAYKFCQRRPTSAAALGDDDDVVQLCLVALLLAAERFDPTVSRFSTYATSCMVLTLCKHARDADMIRIPRHVSGDKRSQMCDKLTAVSISTLDHHDMGVAAPEDVPHIETQELRAEVEEAMRRLPPTWQRVLRRRSEGWSLRRLGLDMGITPEAVRQIETRALAKLRAILGVEDVTDGGFPIGRRECMG